MKRTVSVALTVLVLSAGAAFAEIPRSTVSGDYAGVGDQGFVELSESDMAAVAGQGFLSGACTVGFIVAGNVLILAGLMVHDSVLVGAGLLLQSLRCY